MLPFHRSPTRARLRRQAATFVGREAQRLFSDFYKGHWKTSMKESPRWLKAGRHGDRNPGILFLRRYRGLFWSRKVYEDGEIQERIFLTTYTEETLAYALSVVMKAIRGLVRRDPRSLILVRLQLFYGIPPDDLRRVVDDATRPEPRRFPVTERNKWVKQKSPPRFIVDQGKRQLVVGNRSMLRPGMPDDVRKVIRRAAKGAWTLGKVYRTLWSPPNLYILASDVIDADIISEIYQQLPLYYVRAGVVAWKYIDDAEARRLAPELFSRSPRRSRRGPRSR